jgi:alkylation response protein AidB-like acyl-CoA dehydrogenase
MTNLATRIDTEDLVALASEVGRTVGLHSRRHDEDGTFVTEGLDALRAAGLPALAVPVELGGMGATVRQVAAVQRELARWCGSTALASSMHQHVVCFTAWRYRRGLPGAEATLRRVADEGIVLVSTGGADWTRPRGEAKKVEGGYRVSGHKVFASQSSHGNVLSTMFAYDDPDQGRRVLNMAAPIGDGVTVLDNWDTLGMRGTASNDIVIDDVFVPDERVLANRPVGTIDPPLQVIGSIAFPIITAVYLGVAEAAFDAAREAVASKAADDVILQRQVGLMAHRIRIAAWALDRAIDEIGDDPEPSMERFAAAMAAKREVALAGVEVCDLAMEVAGGSAFFKGSTIERCYRDIRAAKFHPLTPEQTLTHAGRLALGLPADEA